MITHMPLDTVLSNSTSEPSRPSSLFSRFSSPISKRARNIFDFTIEPKEPFRTYAPGDTIHGHIVLSVLKGFDITHLTVALHGYAKVFKHQSERRPTTDDLVNGQGTRSFEYLGNGLASLFQDEQVLCGSGFLKKQIYKFGFELQFPSSSLPTTIDFERGTIGYMISATVTRPTTIAPTMTKTVVVKVRDRIDISALYTPKTRVISLEPINKRGKVKKVKTNSSLSTLDASTASRRGLTRNNTGTSDGSRVTAPVSNPPLSPAPSEDTIATNVTASTGSMQVVEHGSPTRKESPQTSETRSSITSSSAHTITATVEIPRHGAIPGDTIPIHISVSHTKPRVRGVIIATLYRMIRVDMHPVIPLSTKGKNKKQEYEDVYPRSRTGLGGLYFSNSSPSSVFRKDLSQSSTLMIINPQTLTAKVNTSVKIPVEDALPTLTNIPGGMISFTYHIEVVIDLAGKLGESRFLPSLTSNGPTFTTAQEAGNQLTADWANNILDTTPLRRTKNVVTSVLPLIVGTKDTNREQRQMDLTPSYYNSYENDDNNDHGWEDDLYGPDGYDPNAYWNEGHYYDEFGNPIYSEWYGYNENHQNDLPQPYVPLPEPMEDGDEKTRLRRQEELLMPSQPPESGQSSTAVQAETPSAPSFVDGVNVPSTPVAGPSSRPAMPMSISRASARSGETIIPGTITPPPSLPDEEHINNPTEDKQELERRRLMAQASAPPTDQPEASSSAPSAPAIATAPVIDEEEEYISRALRNERFGSESLPRYQQ